MGTSPKLADFFRFSQFSMLLLTDFGSRGDPIVRGTPGSSYGDLDKKRRFVQFFQVFCGIIKCFLVVVVVRTFGEARGPVTRTSPKLPDIVRFGQLCMLLLTVFGSRWDANIRGTPRSAYGDLAKTRKFCPFLPVFYAIIHCFLVVVVVRTFGEARGPVTGSSPKLANLVHSYQFSMLLPTDFASRGDPNVRGSMGSGYGDLSKTRRFCPF
jgi:hypothetical protein